MTIDEYLERISRFADSKYGRMVRTRFRDHLGSSELAMLASPTADELSQLRRAVAIMTPNEKQNAADTVTLYVSCASAAAIERELLKQITEYASPLACSFRAVR